MRYQVLTIFPELFEPFCQYGLLSRAIEQGLVQISTKQLRDFAINTHGQIDDTPYGGGSGMVLRCESAVAAIRYAKEQDPRAKVVMFTPRGKPLTAELAREIAQSRLSEQGGLILLPYRYEGIDERVAENYVDYEISLGDFVLMGGEVAAMGLIEATARFVPGVLGNPESVVEESFQTGLLEYPQYTKPQEYEGHVVPEVLMSGNHQLIRKWRAEQSLKDTILRRPELAKVRANCEINVALIHYPVMNREGKVVTSSVTNLDIHDIARSAKTYGISNYYIVHPTKAMRRLCEKICEHWDTGYGAEYNHNRKEALATISIVPEFDDVLADIELRNSKLPKIVSTSAKPGVKMTSYPEMRREILSSNDSMLILFGTGWGLHDDLLERSDYQLEPVEGYTDYNHLSVRAAAAIIFDRLLGKH